MALSIPSVPFIPPWVFVILFWKSCKCLTVGPGIQTKTSRVWSLKKCANAPPQDNTKILGHFRVPKTLTYKMRLGAQPFLWKRVLFAENEIWFPYQRLSTYPSIETEARGNSKMSYYCIFDTKMVLNSQDDYNLFWYERCPLSLSLKVKVF